MESNWRGLCQLPPFRTMPRRTLLPLAEDLKSYFHAINANP
jgi:hypothetical protein